MMNVPFDDESTADWPIITAANVTVENKIDRTRNTATVSIPYPAFYEAKEIAIEHGMYQGSSAEFFPGTPGKEGTLFLFDDGPRVPLGALTPNMVQILFGFRYTVDAQGAQL